MTVGWILLVACMALGVTVALAWFFASASHRADVLRKDDPTAAATHDVMYLQMGNPAALQMRDHAFDKPKH